jgi:hypothetical protein
MSSTLECGTKSLLLIANKSFGNVAKFRYMGKRVTNQNYVHEEDKSKLKLGKACYRSVQNLLYSRLLSINIRINIYETTILSVVLYECEN